MSKNSTIYIVIIGILLICLLASVGILTAQMVNNPLGIKGFLTINGTSTSMNKIVSKSPSASLSTTLPSSTPPPTVLPLVCGRNGKMTIQVIGRDEYHWELPYGADSIRYVQIDFDLKQATVFAFQRDLYLKSQWMNNKYGIPESKLGSVYNTVIKREGNVDSKETNIKATNAVGQVLYENFAVAPHNYATFMAPFLTSIVNELGGIQVIVTSDININGAQYTKGTQTMNGSTAELYFRYINPNEDEWARFDRQNAVLKGLAKKITEPSTITKIPELYSNYKNLVFTDLSLEDVTQLICIYQEIPSEKITVTSIPPDMVTIQSDGTMIIKDMTAAQKYVDEYLK